MLPPGPRTGSHTRPLGGAPARPNAGAGGVSAASVNRATEAERDARATRRKLVISVVVLIALLVIGAAGFYLLGDGRTPFQALYVTVVILTTVGMKEGSVQLNEGEQVWAIVLMLVGISTALYVAGNLVAFIIEGDLRRILGRRHLKKQIEHLRDHYIVCGFGRMGRALCESLAENNVPFIVIDYDQALMMDADELGYLYLVGDAMSEQVLYRARVEQAAGLAACLATDADNVFVTLTARGLNPELSIIARAEHEETQAKLMRAGASRVICPPLLGAGKISQMLLNPAVDELIDMAETGSDIEISKVRLSELPKLAGRTLRHLDLHGRAGLIVVAIIHADGQRVFSPPADSKLQKDDEMIVVGPTGGVKKMLEKFGE